MDHPSPIGEWDKFGENPWHPFLLAAMTSVHLYLDKTKQVKQTSRPIVFLDKMFIAKTNPADATIHPVVETHSRAFSSMTEPFLHMLKCKLGWNGKYCNECVPYLGCHHGTCQKPWECNCEDGWGGQLCNQDLNFCTHHKPCKNGGLCTNSGEGSYTCTCTPGFEGDNCEREVGDCQNLPCRNGGKCMNEGGRFKCQCPQGYYGVQCERQAVSCLAKPCNNGGTCVERGDSYYCLCPPGYTDYNCATEVDECQSSPCQNGGRCVDQLDGYRCVCPSGYSGSECQHDNDDCVGNPCGEHGYCVDLVNDYRCQCHPGYVGALCLEDVDDCEMRPCANGGHCTDLVNDFQCDCAPGFEGKDCSLQIDECRDSPCLHEGICQDRLADYTCSCPEGFWGKNCEKYEGMPVDVNIDNKPDNGGGNVKNNTFTARPSLSPTTVGNGDSSGQMDSSTGEQGDGDDGLSMTQLLVIVCLGVGIPLILIIIAVTILLCRKRSYLQQRQHTQQNLENMAREKERHYINNMNNKSSTTVSSNLSSPTSDPNIFTTLPSSASNSSSIKISNEEQQDINKLKAKHLMLAGDCGLTTSYTSDLESPVASSSTGNAGAGGGGGSTLNQQVSGAGPHQLTHNTACPNNYLRDVVAITHKELRLQTPSPPSSSVLPSSSSAPVSKGVRRGSDCDLDFEKTYRRLDVDSLQADTNRPLSEYQRYHSQHKKAPLAVNPPQVPRDYSASDTTAPSNISTINTVSSRDTPTAAYNSPTVYLGGYNSSLPSLTPQQQQLLQERLKRHSRYDEDFLATEV
ncbi:delta-like protein [Elysia marginata]|uniref:Delta-like protein n=1 Tax=Elysia marginata TaxID=1093978 RepID=A0AAV4EHY5_9GAST|nr:delta-like protein [Elysia marginata]